MILNYEAKENKMIDVSAGDIYSLRSYLIGAKKLEKYEDLRLSMTEYTPKGSIKKKCCIPAKRMEQFRLEKRKELFEDFVDNKYFDAELVDKILSFDNVFFSINLHLSLSDICDEAFYDGRVAYVYNQLVVELGAEESEAKEVVDEQLQLVDKMDYKERGYCRYCEKPTKETIAVIDEIYEKAKLVMNYLLKRNADREMIKLAIADRNLDKSYCIIEKNQNVSAEDFIKELGV